MYIGQTICSLKARIKKHYNLCKNEAKHRNYFLSALRKYKKEDWKWEVLVKDIPENQLDLMERAYIWGLSTYGFGYNSTRGGDDNPTKNPETAKKVSISLTGKVRSAEHCKNLSICKRGEKNPMFGIHPSEETKLKILAVRSGIFQVIYPNGMIKIIKNLSNFCRENNLIQSCMCRTATGKNSNHKGFKVKKLNG